MSHFYHSFRFDNKVTCYIFQFVRQTKLPFNINTPNASVKFDLSHFNIRALLSISFVHNHKYFLTILDDHTRFVWSVLLKSKSKAYMHVQKLYNYD